ncbi:MAG: flagellar basal body P-ring formation chaperone FlgA [Planctomycetota bacterium]
MQSPLTTAAFALLLLASATAGAHAADLLLRERAMPTGSIVRLGEIATVLRATPSEAARLSALPLMPAPAPGTEQVIRGQQLRDLLEAHGVDLMDIRFDGATRVTVGERRERRPSSPTTTTAPAANTLEATPAPNTKQRSQVGFRLVTEAPPKPGSRPRRLPQIDTTAAAKSLADSLNAYVRRRMGDDLMRVRDVQPTPRQAASLAEAVDQLVITSTEAPATGSQRFLVSFATDAGPVRFPVYGTVERVEPVVVATAPIPRGSLITNANTRLGVLDEDFRPRANESLIPDLETAIGREAARSIQTGQPVTDSNSEPPIMVRRGDLVDVKAGSGGVVVRMKATARRDGREGEVVEIEALGDRRRLEGRVTGYGELSVVSSARSGATSARRAR